MQVIAVMGQGGAERMALQLATDGARHGEPAAIAAVPGDWADRVAGSGAQFYPIPLLRRSPLAVAEGVRALRGGRQARSGRTSSTPTTWSSPPACAER